MYKQWWQARKRAARKGVPFELTESDIEKLLVDTCPVLGLKLESGDATGRGTSPSINRIVPELGYVLGNVEIISTRANRMINDGTIHEHELALEHMKRTVPRQFWGYPSEASRVVVTVTQSDLRSNPDHVGNLLEQGCTVRVVSDADPERPVMIVSR